MTLSHETPPGEKTSRSASLRFIPSTDGRCVLVNRAVIRPPRRRREPGERKDPFVPLSSPSTPPTFAQLLRRARWLANEREGNERLACASQQLISSSVVGGSSASENHFPQVNSTDSADASAAQESGPSDPAEEAAAGSAGRPLLRRSINRAPTRVDGRVEFYRRAGHLRALRILSAREIK